MAAGVVQRRVVVTGMGIVSSIGVDADFDAPDVGAAGPAHAERSGPTSAPNAAVCSQNSAADRAAKRIWR